MEACPEPLDFAQDRLVDAGERLANFTQPVKKKVI